MQCWLAGAYALDDDAHQNVMNLVLPIAIRLSASRSSFVNALRSRSLHITGELTADKLAERSAIEGSIALAGRSARYGLRFSDHEGLACELVGTQELSLRRPPRGWSIVAGELVRNHRRIGRVRLRIDPRDAVAALCLSGQRAETIQ